MVLGLPSMAYADNIRKKVQAEFKGYNHNHGAGDGTIWDMENLTSDYAPLLGSRVARNSRTIANLGSIYWNDELISMRGTSLYFGERSCGTLAAGAKVFTSLGGRVLIFPDKKLLYVTKGYYPTSDALAAAVTTPAEGDRYAVAPEEGDESGINDVYEYGTSWVNIGKELQSLEEKYTSTAGAITLSDGTYFSEPAASNSLTTSGAAFAFKVGDAVAISGCATAANNKTAIIREISTDKKTLRFYENTFTISGGTYREGTTAAEGEASTGTVFYVGTTYNFNDSTGKYSITQSTEIAMSDTGATNAVGKYYISRVSTTGTTKTGSTMYKITAARYEDKVMKLTLEVYTSEYYAAEAGAIVLKRSVPELDFILTNENRVWGAKGDTIYASKLGDPYNWNVFDGVDTDSYAVMVGSAGDFTGAVSYLGYPIFFKEEAIYKVYGNKPSNFEVMGSATTGVMAGSSKSLAVAGETLFYLSRSGFVAYSGGMPQNIAAPFGLVRYKDAVGGSDGRKYYADVSEVGTANKHLFVFDTATKMWHREVAGSFLNMAFGEGLLYAAGTGVLWLLGSPAAVPSGYTAETDITSYAEFADLVEDNPDKKGVSKIHLRLELDEGTILTVKIKFDSASAWQTVKVLSTDIKKSYYLPIIPRRGDHYRLRLEATGGWKLYSLAREFYSGSAL